MGARTPAPDAAVLRAWARDVVGLLGEHRARLDEMNVFPVPDSDTGTNLWLTAAEAARAVDDVPPGASAEEVALAFTRGAVVGARGNSGVIVSQYLAGLLESLVAGAAWAGALDAAAQAAYGAVTVPVEGTVLTVAREVAAGAADGGATDRGALAAGLARGHARLGRTREQLPALGAAGVVDAGAMGLLLVLGSLLEHLGGRRPALDLPDARGAEAAPGEPGAPDRTEGARCCDAVVAPDRSHGGGTVAHAPSHAPPHAGHDHGGGEFEVMFVASGPARDRALGDRLRAGLGAVGGSVAVVGAGGLWHGHVHTDRPLDALRVPTAVGAPTRPASVRHLPSQSGVHGTHRPSLGLVVVTGAPGLAPDLARAGAVVVVVAPGQGVTGELERAAADTGAAEVLVLAAVPVPPGRRPAHEVVESLAEVQLVAGAAALALAAPGTPARAVRDVVVDAVAAVRWGRVPDVGAARQAGDVHAAALTLLDPDPAAEVLTVVTGDACPAGLGADVRDRLTASRPGVEVVLLERAVPGADVLLGAE